MNFSLALAQMLVRGGDRSANLQRAASLIARAARQGADLVLLPETLDLGWTHPSSRGEAEPVPDGAACLALAEAAARDNVFVCAGVTEADEGRVFNTAVLLDRRGRLLLKHRKLNELKIGHPYYDQGDRLGVAHTELGAVGLMICADAFAKDHVISRALGYLGADIILSPSAWAVPADHDHQREPYGRLWRDCYTGVAREFAVWIAAASSVGDITGGPWAGRKCIGCSLVVDADGRPVLEGPYGAHAETILMTDVALRQRPARGCGWEQISGTPPAPGRYDR